MSASEPELKLNGMYDGDETSDGDLIRLYAPVYEVVRTIPAGKVMTYGQVADATVGISVTARQVGTAMRYVPEGVPWQRVVGAGGHLPIAKRSPEAKVRQYELLLNEGAVFLAQDSDRVDMSRSQWLPETGSTLSLFSDDDSQSK